MSDGDSLLFRGQQMPESIKSRILAAQLLAQSGAQQTGPYTAKSVTALKALSGLLGGLQEHQAIAEAQAGQAQQRTQLAQLLASGATSSAGAGSASGGTGTPAGAGSASQGGIGSDRVATGNPSGYDPKAVEALIRSRAPHFGIDPDTAVKIARSEGLNVYRGDNGSSYGPFQLHYGNVAGGGNAVGGLGDTFTKQTGLDARDPSTVPQQIDFALQNAAQGGWVPWHGRKTAGVGVWDGIGPNYKGPTTTQPVTAASADMPAPNARPVASDALPPGITPDMVGPGALPSGAMPGGAGSAPTADPKLLASLLAKSAPAPASPFGAMPTSMAQAPASVAGSNMDAAANLSRAGQLFSMVGPNGVDPSVVGANRAGIASGLPAAPLSTDALPGFDNFGTDGRVRQSSLGADGYTGGFGPGMQPVLNGNLPAMQAPIGGSGAPPAPPPPAPPAPNAPPRSMSDIVLASMAKAGYDMSGMPGTPAAVASPVAAAAPPPPPVTPPADPMALPGMDNPLGGLMGDPTAPQPAAPPPAGPLPMIASGPNNLAMAAALRQGGPSALPMADPNLPQPDSMGPGSSALAAALRQSGPAPMLADPSLPGPMASGATYSPEPSSRPGAQAMRQPSRSDPVDVPLPPVRPSNIALLNPDAPAPGAIAAGPAPVPPQIMAQALRQPLGLAGHGGGDPNSAQAFLVQEAQRAQGGPSPAIMEQALRGAPASAVPAAASSSSDGGPLGFLGDMFGGGGQGQSGGGNPLAGLPIVGNLLGGQGQQQGAQPADASTAPASMSAPAGGQRQAQGSLGGMSQQQALSLLADPRTSPQEAQLIMSRAFPQPMMEKTADGKIVSIDPRGGPAKVLYAGQGYRPATADERRSYGVEGDRPMFVGPDGKPEFPAVDPNGRETTEQRDYRLIVAEAKARGQTPPSFGEYQTALRHAGSADPGPAGQVFGAIKEQREGAMAAAQSLPAIQQANAAIRSGAILGAGADQRLDLAKTLSLFGYKDQGDAAANTEVFRSAVAPVVLATVKSLGAGSGISNADRDFAEKAAGGNINLEPETIKRLLDLGERAANAKVAAYNDTLNGVYPDSDPKNAQVRQLFQVRMPDMGAPAAAPAPAAASQAAPVAPPAGMAPPQGGGGYLPGAARPGMAPTASAQPQAAPAPSDALAQAQAAIAKGAPRAAVIQRLQAAGINPAGL